MLTKSRLAIELSRLAAFTSPQLSSEQYAADSEVASAVLWNAYMAGDIEGKSMADLGCGTGILGIGCLLLGARSVCFVDNDRRALNTAASNLGRLGLKNYEIIGSDIGALRLKADVVVMNPPFGTKQPHADREFLLKAFETAPVVYSFHKSSTEEFVRKFAEESGFRATNVYRYAFPIKRQHSFHTRRIYRVAVSCFRLAMFG